MRIHLEGWSWILRGRGPRRTCKSTKRKVGLWEKREIPRTKTPPIKLVFESLDQSNRGAKRKGRVGLGGPGKEYKIRKVHVPVSGFQGGFKDYT